jgi:hypothetical protein
MDWEVKDFRQQPEPPKEDWPIWAVPVDLIIDYLLKVAGFILFLPWIFGYVLTPFGLFFNFILIDWIVYRQYKRARIIR